MIIKNKSFNEKIHWFNKIFIVFIVFQTLWDYSLTYNTENWLQMLFYIFNKTTRSRKLLVEEITVKMIFNTTTYYIKLVIFSYN